MLPRNMRNVLGDGVSQSIKASHAISHKNQANLQHLLYFSEFPESPVTVTSACLDEFLMNVATDTQKLNWVAVKGLKLSYYIGETLLFTIYTHYGNLI